MINNEESEKLLLEFDTHWMTRALEQAFAASTADEVPVGAVIVRDGDLIASASNQRESLHDPTAHAEMIAITQAAASIEDWRLERCTLYVTLEPCLMCAGAILQSRIPRVVFGATDPKGGAVTSLFHVLDDPRLNHQCLVTSGILAEQSGRVLTEFFAAKRAMGKK
ncbi:MAG: tRNA adenosine(34) deaminase TadA [Rubripirellula sp.]